MEGQESLDSILSSPVAPEVKAEPAQPVEASKPDASRDEAGRFAAKPIEAAAEPGKAVEKEPLKSADVAAIIDERRKRQQLEQRLAQLETAKPKADFWEDPERALSERVDSAVNPLRDQNFSLQLELARLRNSDFDEVMMEFLKASQSDDVLRHQADNSPNPLQFIYREGKRLKELGPYGGDLSKRDEAKFGEFKAQLSQRDESIKALTAELDALKKTNANLESIPRSLNRGSEPGPKSVADTDPEDIRSIVRFGNNPR